MVYAAQRISQIGIRLLLLSQSGQLLQSLTYCLIVCVVLFGLNVIKI